MDGSVASVERRGFWRRHLELARNDRSGKRGYCRRHRLSPNAFFYWQRKLMGERGKKGAVEVAGGGFARVVPMSQGRDADFSDVSARIRLPGVEIRVSELPRADWVARLSLEWVRGQGGVR